MGTRRGTIEVWIVEDDRKYRSAMQDLVNDSEEFFCEQALGACEEALEILKAKDPPRITLVDIGLPGMSGIEGIRRMKQISPSTEFIVLTVQEDHRNVLEAICSGATGYLLKDLPPEKILERVREVLEGGAPMNPTIARHVLTLLSGQDATLNNYGLSNREREVLNLMVDGLTRNEIADRLFVSHSTILAHSRNIYAKLHVHTRGGAVAKALKERLV